MTNTEFHNFNKNAIELKTVIGALKCLLFIVCTYTPKRKEDIQVLGTYYNINLFISMNSPNFSPPTTTRTSCNSSSTIE